MDCRKKDQWSQEGERGQNKKNSCSVKLNAIQLKGRPRRFSHSPSLDEWDGHWQPDMLSIEDGVHSALLAWEKVKLIDGWRHHVTKGIQNFNWITRAWAEKQVLEGSLVDHTPCTVRRYSDRWTVGKLVNDVIMSGLQTQVVKSDQEVSIVDVKNSLIREFRGVEGSTVIVKESPVGASAANAVIERSVWEMQSTTRAIVTNAAWVHETVFEPGSAIFGIVCGVLKTGGQQAPKKHSGWENAKDKGEVRNRVGIMLGLVGRSDKVVTGLTARVATVRAVHRMPAAQRGDAAYAKGIRCAPWQTNPVEEAEGEPLGVAQTRIVSVPMVAVEHRPAVPVIEQRDYKARRLLIGREVELPKAKPHSEGCRERIRHARMNDDVGQQKLHAAEQRPSVATSRSGPRRPG